jgi:hypothetical protein
VGAEVWGREAVFTTAPIARASPDSGRDPIAMTASPVFTAALTLRG